MTDADDTNEMLAAQTAVDALLLLAREEAENGVIALTELERIAHAVLDETLWPRYKALYARLSSERNAAQTPQHRSDPLGRLLTGILGELIGAQKNGLPRNELPQLFAALREISGFHPYDAAEADLRQTHRMLASKMGSDFQWDALTSNPLAISSLTRLLVQIARALPPDAGGRRRFQSALEAQGVACSENLARRLALALIAPLAPEAGLYRSWLEETGSPADLIAVETLLTHLANPD